MIFENLYFYKKINEYIAKSENLPVMEFFSKFFSPLTPFQENIFPKIIRFSTNDDENDENDDGLPLFFIIARFYSKEQLLNLNITNFQIIVLTYRKTEPNSGDPGSIILFDKENDYNFTYPEFYNIVRNVFNEYFGNNSEYIKHNDWLLDNILFFILFFCNTKFIDFFSYFLKIFFQQKGFTNFELLKIDTNNYPILSIDMSDFTQIPSKSIKSVIIKLEHKFSVDQKNGSFEFLAILNIKKNDNYSFSTEHEILLKLDIDNEKKRATILKKDGTKKFNEIKTKKLDGSFNSIFVDESLNERNYFRPKQQQISESWAKPIAINELWKQNSESKKYIDEFLKIKNKKILEYNTVNPDTNNSKHQIKEYFKKEPTIEKYVKQFFNPEYADPHPSDKYNPRKPKFIENNFKEQPQNILKSQKKQQIVSEKNNKLQIIDEKNTSWLDDDIEIFPDYKIKYKYGIAGLVGLGAALSGAVLTGAILAGGKRKSTRKNFFLGKKRKSKRKRNTKKKNNKK
jgi:hypothetical protein